MMLAIEGFEGQGMDTALINIYSIGIELAIYELYIGLTYTCQGRARRAFNIQNIFQI